jgi:hypothetical protein
MVAVALLTIPSLQAKQQNLCLNRTGNVKLNLWSLDGVNVKFVEFRDVKFVEFRVGMLYFVL